MGVIRVETFVFILTDRGADLRGRSILITYFVLADLQPLFHPFDDGSELLVRVSVDDDGRRGGRFFSSEDEKYQRDEAQRPSPRHFPVHKVNCNVIDMTDEITPGCEAYIRHSRKFLR